MHFLFDHRTDQFRLVFRAGEERGSEGWTEAVGDCPVGSVDEGDCLEEAENEAEERGVTRGGVVAEAAEPLPHEMRESGSSHH